VLELGFLLLSKVSVTSFSKSVNCGLMCLKDRYLSLLILGILPIFVLTAVVLFFLFFGTIIGGILVHTIFFNNKKNIICSKLKSETRYWAKSKNRAGQVRSLLPMYTKALSHPTRSYYMQFIPIYFPIQALFFF
jgi:hypothetical protein